MCISRPHVCCKCFSSWLNRSRDGRSWKVKRPTGLNSLRIADNAGTDYVITASCAKGRLSCDASGVFPAMQATAHGRLETAKLA